MQSGVTPKSESFIKIGKVSFFVSAQKCKKFKNTRKSQIYQTKSNYEMERILHKIWKNT